MNEPTLDPARARALLGTPEMAWLVERLRRRVEQGKPLRGLVSRRDASPAERRALDALMGRAASTGKSLSLRLEQLEERLRRAQVAPDLRSALEALTGPLADQRARRRERRRQWDDVLAEATERLESPILRDWLADRRTLTLLRRASGRDPEGGRQILAHALAVVRTLPADGLPLAELAASALGNSHALDSNRRLAALVVDAASRLGGLGPWNDLMERHGRGAEVWQRVWESVGVSKDDLSASVLVHALPASGHGLCDKTLRLHAATGEPCRLTTGQLLRHPPSFDRQQVPRVHVCENPAVVAAARRLGTGCAPLVCGDGRPTLAVHTLLRELARAGIALAYHGDFDWAGISIATQLIERHAMTPWRFATPDYLAAPDGPPLGEPPTGAESPWDPTLVQAMTKRGQAVEEEQVLEGLLEDLGK